MMDVVTAKNGWNTLLDSEAKKGIYSFLDYYKPASLLLDYVNPQNIALHIDEVFSPERAGTFSVDVTKEDVLSYILFEEGKC